MEIHMFGVTLEERIEAFQSGVMWSNIYRGLLLVAVKSLLVNILDLEEGVLLTVVMTIGYALYLTKKYRDFNIHHTHEVYSYKGKLYNFRDDDPGVYTIAVNNNVRKFMTITTVALVGIGMFFDDFLHVLSTHYDMTLILVGLALILTLVGAFPLVYLYGYGYKWMVYYFTVAVQSPVVAVIYADRENSGETLPTIEEYITWKNTKKHKRKKNYTSEDNERLQQFHTTLLDEIDDRVIVYESTKRVVFTDEVRGKDGKVHTEKTSKANEDEALQEFDIKELDETYEEEGDDNEQK